MTRAANPTGTVPFFGIHIKLTGEELADKLRERAAYWDHNVEELRAQVATMRQRREAEATAQEGAEEHPAPPVRVSRGGLPTLERPSMIEQLDQHIAFLQAAIRHLGARAEYCRWMADHSIPEANYLLRREDLAELAPPPLQRFDYLGRPLSEGTGLESVPGLFLW